jgi:hypothetical protein
MAQLPHFIPGETEAQNRKGASKGAGDPLAKLLLGWVLVEGGRHLWLLPWLGRRRREAQKTENWGSVQWGEGLVRVTSHGSSRLSTLPAGPGVDLACIMDLCPTSGAHHEVT